MCEHAFFCVWFSGWIAGLGVIGAALISGGAFHLNTKSEDTREGKIERFCEKRKLWDDDGYKTINDFDFPKSEVSSVSVKCELSGDPVITNSAVDGNSMTDGKCGQWKANLIRCGSLEQLVPAPEFAQGYSMTLRSQRRLLSKTGTGQSQSEVTSVGDLVLKVGWRKVETISFGTSKTCNSKCARRAEHNQCFENSGQVTSSGDDTRCLTSYRLYNPCFVIEADQKDTGKAATSFAYYRTWSVNDGEISRPESRCEKPPDQKLKRAAHQNVDPNTPEDSASLKNVLEQREVVFRSSDDPFVVAAQLTDGTFDMGWTETQLKVMGTIMIVIGSLFGCCSLGCLCACGVMMVKICER
mmetsp:Transcript_9789/g.17317  ORF Transcript_9789/g.17317 Transcript_9789/m.17317 type:complete len:355 (+) Transcript_9789:103-1167(+)